MYPQKKLSQFLVIAGALFTTLSMFRYYLNIYETPELPDPKAETLWFAGTATVGMLTLATGIYGHWILSSRKPGKFTLDFTKSDRLMKSNNDNPNT